MSADTQQPLSPTTGEPISTIGRRARAGLWTLIVMDAAGTIAIIIAYSYLWALNVNGGWAPPGASLTGSQTDESLPSSPPQASFAVEWPFWAIFGLGGLLAGLAAASLADPRPSALRQMQQTFAEMAQQQKIMMEE